MTIENARRLKTTKHIYARMLADIAPSMRPKQSTFAPVIIEIGGKHITTMVLIFDIINLKQVNFLLGRWTETGNNWMLRKHRTQFFANKIMTDIVR